MRTLLFAFRNRFSLFTLVLLLGSQAWAGTVYTVNRSIGATGSVVGTIETDGGLGTLTSSNILSWSLTISDDQVNFLLDDRNNSSLMVTGDLFTATDQGLFFDFSGSDGHVALLDNGLNINQDWWCLTAQGAVGCGAWAGAESVARDFSSAQHMIHQGLVQIATVQGGGQVPEPATLPMVAAAGMLALGLRRKRR